MKQINNVSQEQNNAAAQTTDNDLPYQTKMWVLRLFTAEAIATKLLNLA